MQVNGIDIKVLLEEFVEEQAQLLINDASEQAISCQLAMKLCRHFTEWNIDCEYNRRMEDVKRLIYAVSPNAQVEERNVVPDIIVHRRNTNDNLLAIEIKKTTNQQDDFKDLSKLAAFREQLGYQHSLFVRFIAGKSEAGIFNIEFQ